MRNYINEDKPGLILHQYKYNQNQWSHFLEHLKMRKINNIKGYFWYIDFSQKAPITFQAPTNQL